MIRIAVTALFFVLLIVATVVRVVALWPQPSSEVVQPLPLAGVAATTPGSLSVAPPAGLFERLQGRFDDSDNHYESLLLQGLLLFHHGHIDQSISRIELLTRQAPRFELAHLVLGDLLLARFTPLKTIGGAVPQFEGQDYHQRLDELRSEARARLHGYLSRMDDHQSPRALVSLGEKTPYALVIDKSKNRLYVFRNQGEGVPPRLVDDFYIVLGQQVGDKMIEGDLKTPTGTYFVTSYIDPEKLPPMYGSGAFPINYPNEYDRRRNKSGFGIWLHGTDRSLFSRPPLDSEGCVVLTNEEFEHIREYVQIGRTPVVITEGLEWLPPGDWQRQNQDVKDFIEEWRHQWEEGDLQGYLNLYADDFWSAGHDYHSWSRYKQQVFSSKTYQQIAVSDLSLYEYPRQDNEPAMIVANFVQHYRSNNFNGDMRKRLYLVKQQNQWQVLYEGGQ
ncbi:L,D-transpeptidase family protein [Pelovirga terrestris]|uniref:L,D-transpeptidase family protein n=1 Tax=Pelovirga terrestris TaxID=2771352 RepID=A0A8J6URB1_9BACT|nr:L,D-transpeptidase family protein [Pelovirga terrestris]MBD1400966.1 L,D-transpeptidase family protein [Pelovirga terrestris]